MESSFNDVLGLQPGDEEGTVVLDPRPEHQIVPNVLHFAILATVAEVAAARAVAAAVVPASIHLNLLRPARAERVVGRGTVVRRGRRATVAEGEVWQGDRLVAKATVQFAMMGGGGER